MQLDRMKTDEGKDGHEADDDVVGSKTVVGLRERRDRAVKGVTRLLEGVLETLRSTKEPQRERPTDGEARPRGGRGGGSARAVGAQRVVGGAEGAADGVVAWERGSHSSDQSGSVVLDAERRRDGGLSA